MKHFLCWRDRKISFVPGEMLAYTLLRQCRDNTGFGETSGGQVLGLFCGIGACQGCLVKLEGRGIIESCLTPSQDGMRVQPIQPASAPKTAVASYQDDD